MVYSALPIEAWALRIACVVAKERNLSEVLFESDCKELINCINNSPEQCPWENAAVVEDIKTWAASEQWSFVWCNREKNRAAHWVATSCLSRSLFTSMGCIPPDLELIVAKEVPS